MKLCFRQFLNCLDLDLASYPHLGEVQSVRCSALRRSIVKKYIDNVSPDANTVALNLFLRANNSCRDWKLESSSLLDDHLIGEFREELYRFWWKSGDESLCSSVHDLYRYGRTGPGSTLGANGTDYYSKLFSSKLTTTSKYLYDIYRQHAKFSPITDHAEKARFSDYGGYSVVEGNHLHFVPKANNVSRVICVEPSLNLFFQMGFRHILESRLRQIYDIDLSTQPGKNRELALLGSLDGHLSTIDLSSASDSVSLKMLSEFFPKSWVDIMKQLRSRTVRLPDGRSEELFMVSSMGNAFTFPLETIIFRAVLSAAARVNGLPVDRGTLGVFGDDIICPSFLTSKVLRLLKLLGFSVNIDKTFVEGPFRESCGHDYFNGHDVRGVYIRKLSTQQDRYVAINLLNAWSAKSNIPLPNAVQYLMSTVTRNYIPPAESFDAGILVPESFLIRKVFDANGSILYRPFRPRPTVLRINSVTHRVSGFKSKSLSWNPFGLLESFLRGYVRDSVIPVRSDWVTYSSKRNVTPNWDYIPMASTLGGVLNPFKLDSVKQQWYTAVYVNFFT